jgi:hypothetical protein
MTDICKGKNRETCSYNSPVSNYYFAGRYYVPSHNLSSCEQFALNGTLLNIHICRTQSLAVGRTVCGG